MSENKFLTKMRGEKAPKSLIEVKNDKFSTPFVDLPKSTSVTDGFDNEAEHSIVVAKSAQNWALQKSGIELIADAESADYTGQVPIAGHGMWVNSSYTFPLSEEPANPVVAIINPCAKWVLNFVGKDLFSQNDTIGFTLVVKVGATHISNIDCEVKRQAGFFCKKFVIDFSESEQELIKVNGGDTLTVQLVCNDDTASAVYYTGVSVLSLLQRKVDGDVVAGDTKTFGDLVEDVYNIKKDIDNRFFGVYKFKGTVPTYTALPQQNNVIGDTYNVNDTGSNYTWDGTAWDKLSETVELTDYVKNTDYASANKGGVVLVKSGYGIGHNTSAGLYTIQASEAAIDKKTNQYVPITPKVLDYAVKSGVTKNTIELTDEEKATAQAWLGVAGKVDVAGDTMTGTLNVPELNVQTAEGTLNMSITAGVATIATNNGLDIVSQTKFDTAPTTDDATAWADANPTALVSKRQVADALASKADSDLKNTPLRVEPTGKILVSNQLFAQSTNNTELRLQVGSETNNGSLLALYGQDSTQGTAGFLLRACLEEGKYYDLVGRTDGNLWWNGERISCLESEQLPTIDGGYVWYKVYDDGFVIQGGRCTGTWEIAAGQEQVPYVTMAIPMNTTHTFPFFTCKELYCLPMGWYMENSTTLRARFGAYSVKRTLTQFDWVAFGRKA